MACSRMTTVSQDPLLPQPAIGDIEGMQTEPSNVNQPKRKRRWFQFSLRTLMVFTAVCTVSAGWLGKRIEQKRNERVAVEAIVRLGGRVAYDYERDSAKPHGPEWLRGLLGEDFFTRIVGVDLCGCATLTDAGLVNVNGMTQLQTLNLFFTTIGDAGVENVRGLSLLQSLDLSETQVTDAGLERLEGLTRLAELRLGKTNITDDGLVHLKGLGQLRTLYLWDTMVTDAGVKDLQKSLPTCKIVR
jgi:Leucine Rich repeat